MQSVCYAQRLLFVTVAPAALPEAATVAALLGCFFADGEDVLLLVAGAATSTPQPSSSISSYSCALRLLVCCCLLESAAFVWYAAPLCALEESAAINQGAAQHDRS